MGRDMYGSGKFIDMVSNYAMSEVPDNGLTHNDVNYHPSSMDSTEREISEQIPPVPQNPDSRHVIVRYAEEYFGKYWFVTLGLVLILLFYLKKKL